MKGQVPGRMKLNGNNEANAFALSIASVVIESSERLRGGNDGLGELLITVFDR